MYTNVEHTTAASCEEASYWEANSWGKPLFCLDSLILHDSLILQGNYVHIHNHSSSIYHDFLILKAELYCEAASNCKKASTSEVVPFNKAATSCEAPILRGSSHFELKSKMSRLWSQNFRFGSQSIFETKENCEDFMLKAKSPKYSFWEVQIAVCLADCQLGWFICLILIIHSRNNKIKRIWRFMY